MDKAITWVVFYSCVLSSVLAFPPTPTPPKPSPNKCGYQSCHPVKDGYINVHIVPHTHDDVGWLKTVDQYYYGSRSNTQVAGVQYILDSVIDALKKDPNRRFIYVETAFFWKWWMKQHDILKHQVKRYVKNGQLEFIGGAWSMNDEADTHYQSTIDQFTWGLRKLNETFGECGRPKIGWQIDPFGHSREMASIFAQLGYDGLLLGRIDYQDKSFRFKTKSAEMIWQGSSNLGDKSRIFTGVMYNTYGPPPGFCFDVLCRDDPIIDDKKSTEYNVDKKVDDFISYVKNVSNAYATNNVIITMGEDFNYQDAHMWFKNLDKLIKYVNERQANGSRYNLLYSTPSCYVKAVHDEAAAKGKKWLVKQDDFFPYASDPHAYWTGYFTSRPTLKRFERVGNNYLQVCKQLYALTDLGPEDRVDLNAMRQAMGVMQHHDAITGTEKEHVAHDYARLLQVGFDECDIITSTALSNLMLGKSEETKDPEPGPKIPFTSCLLTNTSSCAFTEKNDKFVVTVYNPLSRPVSKYVRLPVLGKAYKVTDPDGNNLAVQLIPIHPAILEMPGRESEAKVELIFHARDIPPLGYKSYYVTKVSGNNVVESSLLGEHKIGDISFRVDERTGLISQLSMNNINLPLSQTLLYYNGFVGDNKKESNRSSGAYIFRPLSPDALEITQAANIKIFKGELVAEVQQIFNDWASQTIRIYNEENFIEFDWIVGPIPVSDIHGKEVVSRFKTNLKTNSTFYTDSNGREMLKRVRNFRPTWFLNLQEPVAGNYYPVTSKIVMKDLEQNVEVAVLTDRAQGGTSLEDGVVELMVHRACMHDDGFGVDEALIEEAFDSGLVARGSHYLITGPINGNNTEGYSVAAQERALAQRKLLSAWTFLSPPNGLEFKEYQSQYKMQYSGLTRALPNNVQILTLEPWIGFSFLLRLEHVLEANEDPILSKPAVVDLQNLFTPFEITNIRETTLGANQWLEDNRRLHFEPQGELHQLLEELDLTNDIETQENLLKWRYETLDIDKRDVFSVEDTVNDFKISLTPMQIRTLVIDIKKK